MSRVDQKRVLKLVTPEEAFRRLQQAISITKLDSESVPIENACGRVLAESIVSSANIPSINRSAVDGYAVKAGDTKKTSPEKPLKLKIKAELFPASAPNQIGLSPGHTLYLACGAPIPDGSDAVIRIEETRRHGNEVEVCYPIQEGKNIILIGEDVKRGSTILNEGHILRPQDIGQLAALRIRKVKVVRKPRVAILSIGDELTELEKDEPSKTINNYSLVISALATEFGATSEIIGIAPDALSKIVEKIEKALSMADLIITIGGCSVGVRDFVPDAVNAIGRPGVVAHGIKMTPGKVTGLGAVKDKPIVMLPGHIVSSVAGFQLFVAPLIRLYSGLNALRGPEIKAKLSQDVKAKPGMKLFLRLSLRKTRKGFVAAPIRGGSSSLSTLINANGFAVLNEGEVLKKGTELAITLFSEKELLQL